jgi:hypothetical protein
MPDNLTLPGTGQVAKTDQLAGGEHVQVIKIADGTADGATMLIITARGAQVEAQGGVASEASDSGFPVKIGGKYNATAIVLSDGDRGDVQLSVNGFMKTELGSSLDAVINAVEADNVGVVPFRRADAFQATVNSADASGADQAVKAATASKRHYISDLIISVGSAISVTLKDGATIIGQPMYLAANTTIHLRLGTPLMGSINTAFNIRTSGAGNVSVTALGYTV